MKNNMNVFKKSMIAVLFLVVVLPTIALAADSLFSADIFSENVEKVVEIVNLILALFVGVYAIKLAALSQGGTMEKTWNTLAVVAVLFVLVEAFNSLAAFGFVHIGGLSEILEFLFAAVFVYCLYFTKKDLLKKTLG